MNQSLWPIALVGGIVCTYLPVGSADTVFATDPVLRSERLAMSQPALLLAAAESEKASGTESEKASAPSTTTTTSSHLPTAEEVRDAAKRSSEKAVAAGKRAGEAVKREWQRFERAHPQATRPTTTTITTGDPKTPLVIRQNAASQP